MKRILTLVAALALSALSFAQNAGSRNDITTLKSEDKVYELFTYTDADGMFGYYLGLGAPDTMPETLTGVSGACVYLGTNATEAQRTLNALVALFESPAGVSQDFTVRALKGGTLLAPAASPAAVQILLLGAKRLSFSCDCSGSTFETYMRKNAARDVSEALKDYLKQHPAE